MKVADVMTSDIATCGRDDSLNRAAQLMWELRCGAVTVLDEAGRAVGIVTDRDICMAAYTQGRRLDDLPVAIAMSRSPLTCPASASIEDGEDIMAAHGIHRLVVVDEDGRPCGILSLHDIARSGAQWDGKAEIDLERVALTLGEIARRSLRSDGAAPGEETPPTGAGDAVANSLAALQTLRDEIRVDLHLAGQEVRDRWRRLEARLRAAEAHARGASRDAAKNVAELLESAKKFRSRLRAKAAPAAQER
jgi:CBS domain-containing protein